MSVKKVCVSLPQETLGQLEWLRLNVLHAPESASFSGLLQMAVGLAYFKYQKETVFYRSNDEKRTPSP